jgi:HSP90 family molecular chaperone
MFPDDDLVRSGGSGVAMAKANFRVDPRLASLLAENYRSTEHAIRELVDNAWDADADNVQITLPAPLTDQPIVVADDGSGMTDAELQREYLVIAHDRRTRTGERTLRKHRNIRGRKGIGKFAGLVAADLMSVETRAGGKRSALEIRKSVLQASKEDLERIDLPLEVTACDPGEHGTTIVLSQLNTRFSVPAPEVLKEILSLEFGRYAGFGRVLTP